MAQNLMHRVFSTGDVRWRGLNVIPRSGMVLRPAFELFDARKRFGIVPIEPPEPKGCRCGDVITARCLPADCALFGTACTPVHPIGPCMVSSEGTCQAWFKYARVDKNRA